VTELMSDGAFRGMISVLTAGFGGIWAVHDVLFLARLRGADRRDPVVRDQRFAYVMGIIIGTIGVVGTLRFNGVL
jgi:hypothetical protein